MRKLLIIYIILFNAAFFIGCESKTSSLSAEQQKAVENSIEFMENYFTDAKGRIDTNIIKVKKATEHDCKYVQVRNDSQIGEDALDTTDWVVTIGDTSDHGYTIIVCDSSTGEVIGYIPIK